MNHPSQSGDLPESFAKTLGTSDLTTVGIDVAEVTLDSLINDGALRDLPVIGTLVNLWKAGVTVKDALFLRKLLIFLDRLKEIPVETRRDMINSLADKATQENVGEKLLGLLDRLDSSVKARILAGAFSAYVRGGITADEFWRVSFIIDRLPLVDIVALREWRSTDLNRVEHVRKHLYLSVGLGWFVLNTSSSGFVWQEKLCSIFSDVLTTEMPIGG